MGRRRTQFNRWQICYSGIVLFSCEKQQGDRREKLWSLRDWKGGGGYKCCEEEQEQNQARDESCEKEHEHRRAYSEE